jgi:hypothetical protein
VLAGKPPHVHRMGVLDVGALIGRPARLDEAIASQRFSHVVLDWKALPGEWPFLEERYHEIHQYRDGVDAVRSFSGAETSPRRLLIPTMPAPAPPTGGRTLFSFEGGWKGFVPEGHAFGNEPGPAPRGMFGRGAASSLRFTADATGALRSPPFVIDKPTLRFLLRGPRDPGLRVLLLDGPEAAHTATPEGGDHVQTIEWDVGAQLGHTVTLLIEDRSTTGGLVVDEVVAY